MTYAHQSFSDDLENSPGTSSWLISGRAETSENLAFLSGSALSQLHLVLSRDDVPHTLLRARLALRAAVACVTHQGRPERASELRDVVAFLQPGDSAGPAGEVYITRRAVERPVSVKALHRSLPEIELDQIATWLDGCDPCGAGQGAPAPHAAAVLQAVLADRPRDPAVAVILADAALAQALAWSHVLPLLALGLKQADLRNSVKSCAWSASGRSRRQRSRRRGRRPILPGALSGSGPSHRSSGPRGQRKRWRCS